MSEKSKSEYIESELRDLAEMLELEVVEINHLTQKKRETNIVLLCIFKKKWSESE